MPLPSKVNAIEQFTRPQNVRSLQVLLDMINFYHRFIPSAATILRPLYCALKIIKKQSLVWSTEMIAAYNDRLSSPSNATLLAHHHPEAPIAITSNASDAGVGTCLEQFVNRHWQSLAFFSKQLRDPERNYSTLDREMLTLYLAIRHFRFLVEARNFTVFTDHKPFVDDMFKVSDPWTARQAENIIIYFIVYH